MAHHVLENTVLDSSTFLENSQARVPIELIEVTSDGASSRVDVTKDLIETYIENDFNISFNDATHQAKSADFETIKLFRSQREGEYNESFTPISVTRGVYTQIAPYVRIPAVYLHVLEYKTATCTFSTPTLPLSLPLLSPRKMREEYLSFIVQLAPGSFCISASFAYHFKTRCMYFFMHGPDHGRYDQITTAIEQGAASATAFLIPSLVIRYSLEQRLTLLNTWHDHLYSYERELGIRFDDKHMPDPVALNCSKLSKNLNAVNTRLAYTIWACRNTVHYLDFMDKVVKRYRVLAVTNGVPEDQAMQVEDILNDAHAFLRSWNDGIADRAEYLSKRGQALVQTVYSSIAQRDSSISLQVATTSTKLAETSQEIAIAASRDSAVMRVIAAITIFFLPATFTATFFSTTFFNFNADLNGRVYSSWLWLYFVVSIVLTTAVVVGTWILWKKKEQEVYKRLKTGTTVVSLQ